jgi:predicted nuclease of predicted toxin-antitoxin system
VAGRFPLLTDENIDGRLVEGLLRQGWDVVRAIDVFRERTQDLLLLAYAAEHDRALVSTDTDHLSIGERWLREGQSFRLVYWNQGRHHRLPVGRLLDAFERLAAKPDAFAACIEYLSTS